MTDDSLFVRVPKMPEDTPPEPPTPSEPAGRYEWERALIERSAAEGLAPHDQHLALLMATYADRDGTNIRPTATTMAAAIGKNRTTVQNSLGRLRQSGWIEQVQQGHTGRASEYRLTIPSVRSTGHHQ